MYKNRFWLLFLAFIALSTLWYTGIAAYRYYNYSRLETKAVPSSISWRVAEHGSDSYTLVADYQFPANGKSFTGTTDFSSDVYLNAATAQKYIPENAALPWKVWYDKNNPEYSTLEKNYPFKEYIYAIILWGILLYFIWLGFYIAKRQQ